MLLSDLSVITPYGSNVSSCGYCKSAAGSHTYGMSAHFMTCKDYQKLINRGWRRMKANEFEASKHQRQVVNRFNHYIQEGDDNFEKDITARQRQNTDPLAASTKAADSLPAAGPDTPIASGSGPESTLPAAAAAAAQGKKQKPRKAPKNAATDLKTRISSSEYLLAPEITSWRHRFRTKLEPSSCTDEKHALYVKYQMQIHNDPRSKCHVRNFTNFLVDTPLTATKETTWTEEDPGFGSFHQCYYLDEKLIAVSVIDILPECISAVYFFYDPDYSVMSLGKYSAQREIALAQRLNAQPGYEELKYYYMGFYIFTCQKMTYKGQFHPSYLLDPETYNWIEFKKCQEILKEQRYSSFETPTTMDPLFEAKMQTIIGKKKGALVAEDTDEDEDDDDDDEWASVEEEEERDDDEHDLDPDEFNNRALQDLDGSSGDDLREGSERKKKKLDSESEAASAKSLQATTEKERKKEMERVYREVTSKASPGCLDPKKLTIMDLTGVLSLSGKNTLRPVVTLDIYKNYKEVRETVAEYYAHVGEDLANSMVLYIQ
ncbi:Arginyl-tRNA--protein transferase 1 [Mortierella alpina]|uniref:Arginyl-tRNA--protein transferase 1 n=1 Tax=Mortierella alpina TaxID=64518 RepID=A0A9P6M090_MORAP|nr:Arginyl-tRNA--protein transferase 1 [Mortierella alpina]